MPLIFFTKKCRTRLDITHYSELYFKHQQKTNERHERKWRYRNMKENFIIVDQDDNVMFGGQRYNERGANNIWESCNGIWEDEKGWRYIYIKEVEK